MGALGLGFGVGEAAARVPPVALRALGGVVPCRAGCWRPKAPQGAPARRPLARAVSFIPGLSRGWTHVGLGQPTVWKEG